MKQQNDDIKTKENVFEKPIKIIIIVISIAALLLIIEAFYNHSNAIEERKNMPEMNK